MRSADRPKSTWAGPRKPRFSWVLSLSFFTQHCRPCLQRCYGSSTLIQGEMLLRMIVHIVLKPRCVPPLSHVVLG